MVVLFDFWQDFLAPGKLRRNTKRYSWNFPLWKDRLCWIKFSKSRKICFKYEFESWYGYSTITTNNPIDFPFQFSFKLPDPRKERIIWQRDVLGRIIHSKAPEMASL